MISALRPLPSDFRFVCIIRTVSNDDGTDRYRNEVYPVRTRIAAALTPILGPIYLPIRNAFWKTVRSGRPVLKAVRRRIVPFRAHRISGPRSVPIGATEMVVVCMVRDGIEFVDEFVDHYRRLGVKHLFFVDNGSVDGTVERLRALGDDATVYETNLPFMPYKDEIKNWLALNAAGEGWALVADIDEFFDYPRSSRVSLASFLSYLNERGFSAVTIQMLEMFSAQSPDPPTETGTFREVYPLYDLAGLTAMTIDEVNAGRRERIRGGPEIRWNFGGIQKLVFGTELLLTKAMLFRPALGVWTSWDHNVQGSVVAADVTGVFYHYKFAGDFRGRALRAVDLGNYDKGSTHYRNVIAALRGDPGMRLERETTRTLNDVDDLVVLGYLTVSSPYEAFVEGQSERDE